MSHCSNVWLLVSCPAAVQTTGASYLAPAQAVQDPAGNPVSDIVTVGLETVPFGTYPGRLKVQPAVRELKDGTLQEYYAEASCSPYLLLPLATSCYFGAPSPKRAASGGLSRSGSGSGPSSGSSSSSGSTEPHCLSALQ
jgi:hypothetical protein